ncbi:hypothetical protein TNIN_41751, partial [Trichonephila inaurata madagascariensis]
AIRHSSAYSPSNKWALFLERCVCTEQKNLTKDHQ